MAQQMTLGLIVGNRGFFPDHLVEEGRKEMMAILAQEGFKVVCLTPEDTPFGSVETRDDAKKCAALFQTHAKEIDGVVVTLPNFGDERAVAESLRLADLGKPVLIHAYSDDPQKLTLADRRDSFCGKISVCNNLTQYGIPFSLTSRHTMDPNGVDFREDLKWFGGVCRVVNGLRGARIGAIGARPGNFNTVRFSEKILEANGISIEVIDLSEIFGRAWKLADDDATVQAKLAAVTGYICTDGVPAEALMKMAKFATVIDQWTADNELVATALQCWTSIEEYFGIVPCAVMSMMSNALMPSACEVDVTGAIGMLALTLASQRPAALLDWNNNYGEDPDKCIFFHCSNAPKALFQEVKMGFQDIVGQSVGNENAYGTCAGRIAPGPFTFARVSTDDESGEITAYVGEGEFTNDPLNTFGGVGVARVEELQYLLSYICTQGFEHHVAVTPDEVASILDEAMGNYLGWDVYYHGEE